MIKYSYLTIGSCAVMLILYGCSKNNNASSSSSLNNMSATVTRQASVNLFSASGPTYVTVGIIGDIITIAANDTLGGYAVSNFTFVITDYSGAGTYSFDSSSSIKAVYETLGVSFAQTAFAYGKIVVTRVSGNQMSGSFSGTLTDGGVVTDGKFTVSNAQF